MLAAIVGDSARVRRRGGDSSLRTRIAALTPAQAETLARATEDGDDDATAPSPRRSWGRCGWQAAREIPPSATPRSGPTSCQPAHRQSATRWRERFGSAACRRRSSMRWKGRSSRASACPGKRGNGARARPRRPASMRMDVDAERRAFDPANRQRKDVAEILTDVVLCLLFRRFACSCSLPSCMMSCQMIIPPGRTSSSPGGCR